MALITNPPGSIPAGLFDTIQAAGHSVNVGSDGWWADNVAAVQAIIAGYSGSASELQWHQARKLALLEAVAQRLLALFTVADGGSATGITAAQFGAFIAAVIDNHRTIKAAINAAATVAAVDAVSVTTGWPVSI